MRAATCALAWRVAGVQDHEANTSLTLLSLEDNIVGDAGATALAEAVKATASDQCSVDLFQGMRWLLQRMSLCRVEVSSLSVVRLLCNLCVLLLCFFLCLEGKHSLARNFLKVAVARFQNRLDQLSLSPSALARLQCAITARLQDCGGPFELRP